MRAEVWTDLVLADAAPGSPTFTVVAVHHPAYKEPLLLSTPLALGPAQVRAVYRDRWPVEQLPLAAKQMVGAARQFVHAPETCQRLPELALLAGQHPQLCRRHAAGDPDRLLGPPAPADARATAAGVGPLPFSA